MPVPLSYYRKHHAGVELTCNGCMKCSVLDLESVIAGLKVRGRGGEFTGIVDVGKKLGRPCDRCGAVNWSTRPWMPPPANPGIPER